MFDKAKSEAIRRGLNMVLNGKYGEIKALNLESKVKKLTLAVQLNGEAEAVDIEVGRYEINDSNPEAIKIALHELKVSKQWMQELATDQVEGQSFDIPSKLSGVVKMIL